MLVCRFVVMTAFRQISLPSVRQSNKYTTEGAIVVKLLEANSTSSQDKVKVIESSTTTDGDPEKVISEEVDW